MPVCIKCKSRSTYLDFFSFPEDEEVKKKWIDFLKIDGLRKFKKDSKLCSKHFTEDCIVTDTNTRFLKDGSVPSIEGEVNREPKQRKSVSKKKCILCGNNSADLSYFTVPKDEEMKQKWEKFCEFELINPNYNLCHLHFKPSVIMIENGKRKLLPNAIPSIYFDDYQFEFIPVDRKSNGEDNSNDAECTTVESAVINARSLNSSEDSVISIDYSEYNTPPRTPVLNNLTSSKGTVKNTIGDDIVNIFIPGCENTDTNIDDDSANNGIASVIGQVTCSNNVAIFTSSGKRRRLSYPGDIRNEDLVSPDIAKMSFEKMRQVLLKKNNLIRVLRAKVRRLNVKNATLKETVRQLQAEKAAKEAKENDELFEVKGWWDS